MAERDIRSGDDVPQAPDIREDKSWMDKLEVDKVDPYTVVHNVQIPVNVGKVAIPDENGNPMAMQSQIGKRHDEVNVAWEQKMLREPCSACVHFRKGVFTQKEKDRFFLNLVKDHGWKDNLVKADLGNSANYEYCRVYRTLTHKAASCPRSFKRRTD